MLTPAAFSSGADVFTIRLKRIISRDWKGIVDMIAKAMKLVADEAVKDSGVKASAGDALEGQVFDDGYGARALRFLCIQEKNRHSEGKNVFEIIPGVVSLDKQLVVYVVREHFEGKEREANSLLTESARNEASLKASDFPPAVAERLRTLEAEANKEGWSVEAISHSFLGFRQKKEQLLNSIKAPKIKTPARAATPPSLKDASLPSRKQRHSTARLSPVKLSPASSRPLQSVESLESKSKSSTPTTRITAEAPVERREDFNVDQVYRAKKDPQSEHADERILQLEQDLRDRGVIK